jgi:hypothetical protein
MGTGTPRGASAAGGGPSVDYPLPIGLLVLATGCSEGPPDKQWYKPNVNYITADFERDRTACTDKKTKVLDEDCMKDRGWVAFRHRTRGEGAGAVGRENQGQVLEVISKPV